LAVTFGIVSALLIVRLHTRARHMRDDPELRRLKEIERLARERFLRLSLPGTFGGDAEFIKAAEDLWREAAAAVRAYTDRTA
jgi:hypothetical protein